MESSSVEQECVGFSLKEFLSKFEILFSTYVDKQGLVGVYAASPTLPEFVYGAPEALKQVLVNIVMNACQYTQKGGVTMKVEEDRENFSGIDKAVHNVLFVITDSGVGISKEKQEAIFESFEIGEEVLTKRLSGAGVGLAVSKLLTQKMHGKIWVESEPQKGSSFFVSVPFRVQI